MRPSIEFIIPAHSVGVFAPEDHKGYCFAVYFSVMDLEWAVMGRWSEGASGVFGSCHIRALPLVLSLVIFGSRSLGA